MSFRHPTQTELITPDVLSLNNHTDEVTLGYAVIRYTLDDNQYYRVSTVVKKGNWKDRFIWELENFVYNIELKCPISLEFCIFVGSFINNKSNNAINLKMKVV